MIATPPLARCCNTTTNDELFEHVIVRFLVPACGGTSFPLKYIFISNGKRAGETLIESISLAGILSRWKSKMLNKGKKKENSQKMAVHRSDKH